MAVDVRRVRDEDELVDAHRAINNIFGEGADDEDAERWRKTMPPDRVHIALDGVQIVGVAAALPFSITVPGGELPVGGVTWVGVQPTHRRSGVATALMRAQLDNLHACGEPLAALWASEAPIYGRFGYGIAAPLHELHAQKSRFAFRDDPGAIGSTRLISRDEAIELLPPVYERIRTERPGMLKRFDAYWTELRLYTGPAPSLSDRYYVLYELDGSPEGYAIYRLRNKWDDKLPHGGVQVIEALGTSLTATREIWRYLFGIDLREEVDYPLLDPALTLYLGVVDPRRLRLRLIDGLWLRLVDVGAALAARSWATEDALVLAVDDAFCSWNTGSYRRDGTRVDDEPDLVLTAADLASLYLGGVDANVLAAAGRIEERTPGAIHRAAAMFRTPLPPYCAEVF